MFPIVFQVLNYWALPWLGIYDYAYTDLTAVKSIFGALEYVSHCLPRFKLKGTPMIVVEGDPPSPWLYIPKEKQEVFCKMKTPTTPTAVKSIFGALEYVTHCLPSFKLFGTPLIVVEGDPPRPWLYLGEEKQEVFHKMKMPTTPTTELRVSLVH